MYASLFARRQCKIIIGLWQKQLKLLSFIANATNDRGIRNHTTILTERYRRNPSTTWLQQRLHSDDAQECDNHAKPLELSESEDIANFNNADDCEYFTTNFYFKQLYTEEDDIMQKLNATSNTAEVKEILEAENSNLQKEHVVQALILQWMFHRSNSDNHYQNNTDERKCIENILSLLKDYVPKLNINELSICYMYLRKMGIENSDSLLQKILMNALNEIDSAEDLIGLPALSRLLVGINTGGDFFTPMLCANFMRHLQHHIDLCESEEDARIIAICLYNLQLIVSNEMLDLYKKKVSELIASGKLSSATPKPIIKILNLLNLHMWSNRHVPLIRELLLTLETSIKQLNATDLKNICRVYQYHMEPASLHKVLAEAMERLLSTEMTPDALACLVPFAAPQRRPALVKALKAVISSPEYWNLRNSSRHLFYALRGLKITDTSICNTYWNGVLSELESEAKEKTQVQFLRHCHSYMNFNNNMGGSYRHMELEKKLSQLCMRSIEHDLAGRLPQEFTRSASFVLAYGHTPYNRKKYPNMLLSKIINMGGQFTPMDCYRISRGLQISLEMRYRSEIPPLVGMQLTTIDSVLTTCIERHINDEELSATDLNILIRTLINRKTLKDSVVYHKALQKYKYIQYEDLNSRILKDMCYNFIATNYLIPEILDKMYIYLENNREHVAGEIVEKILTCTYNLGYTPQSYDAMYYAGEILLRDFNYMSGLSLVNACLALCYYKTIPEELINKVFCVKFIQRVEEEIQMCYSKATYPERVLNIVMQLNRSACLDFPEVNIPWFQQSFIEAQISKKPLVENQFSRNVRNLLTAILKNESFIRCNHITPYGYQIDFIINFDKNKKPVESSIEATMLDRITKVAILLLKLDSFCENDLNTLRGPDSMKIKHLEMMGYKVLHINEHDWNSKYMNIPGAKKNYLKCLLQI